MDDRALDPLFVSFQLALAGRYSIDRELGRGGMGVVYLAREVHLDRLVAIKLLPPERAAIPSLRERFLREARLAAKLSHPNIIPIHAVDDTAGFVYYVMAFVDGVTLAERVRTRGPMASSEGTRVLRELAWALSYAHGQGLVHRDVKPDNILIETATGRILVADFGIAAAAGLAGIDGISGTPEFMSPEQALGGVIDARSDLYGLGVTAFYMFSGRLPFEGGSATEILAKQVTEPPPSLAALGLSVPRKLALLIDRCLTKDPDHRPTSAEALAEQLGVAMEQRRELPAALRAFVKRTGRIDSAGTLLSWTALVTGATAVAAATHSAAWGFGTLLAGMTLGPLGYFVSVARRLMRLGFSHSDLGPAFGAEIEQAREELAVERSRGASRIESWLRVGMKTTGAASGIGLVLMIGWFDVFGIRVGSVPMLFLLNLAIAAALACSIGYLALLQRRRDVDTEFWAKVWMGRIGKLAFSIARKLLGRQAIGPAMTHRATELSLGMAAEQLYDSLPKASRQALGDLPQVLHRLQADAQSLRKRYDELQEALSGLGDAAISAEFADLKADRAVIHGKLGEAVGALETIRLNLLRLHAGSATVESLTTHLDLAAEVSAEVERLIAAHGEVDRLMRTPG
ncbi:MAG: serine/threonine-protein kinase [Gemmatimonadota bacterium]